MRKPSVRIAKVAAAAAAPVSMLLVGALVWQGSTAAFTAQTRNANNAWAAGQVELTDDSNGSAAFNLKDIVPGQKGTKCIVVSSDATVPGEVRSYFKDLKTSTAGIEDHITLKLERGTGGSFNDCTGFIPTGTAVAEAPLSKLAANSNYASAANSGWEIAGNPGENTTYRGTWEFDTDGLTQKQVDALQGATTGIEMVWELQNEAPAK